MKNARSPLVLGALLVAGTLATQGWDGNGALGATSIFADGFESGDTGAWSSSEPDVPSACALDFEQLILDNVCPTSCLAGDDAPPAQCRGCLEPIVVQACASGCSRYGYNRNIPEVSGYENDPMWAPRLDLHGSWSGGIQYLRKLRNAALTCGPDPIAVPFGGAPLAMTVANLLWYQGEMLMRNGQARFYDTAQNPMSILDVKTDGANTVDVTRFDSLTWVTEGGEAHAMTQGDMGTWFLSLAWNLGNQGDTAAAAYYLYLTRAVFRSFAIRAVLGGVRNDKTAHRCFGDRYCYWFHSRSVGSDDFPPTVLNQHLHGVRDALRAYLTLDDWRNNAPGSPAYPMPLPFVGDPFIDHLLDYARGGLLQLAHAQGPLVDPAEPPNLEDFEVEYAYNPDYAPSVTFHRKRAAYWYYFDGSKPSGESNGPRDITPANTCHYHYHSLNLLAEILMLVQDTPRLMNDPDFEGAYYKLLYGRAAGDTRDCSPPTPEASTKMDGVVLAEYWRAGMYTPGDPFQAWCTTTEPWDLANGTGTFATTGPWFQDRYDGCSFDNN